MEERIYQIALGLLSGIGSIKAKLLVSYAGGLEAVFKESKKSLAKIEGIGSVAIQSMNREAALIRAEAELEFIEHHDIQLYYYQDVNYPQNLKNCEDGPVVLFSKGTVDFKRRSIAVVGTRKSTPYGKKMTHQLIEELAGMDMQIVSGLAHGIDKTAHEASLKNGLPTLGVLGHGLDYIYPAAHRPLAKKMLENGGLVTEFVSKTPGDPSNFPKRNRIVAGLCDATVVIESAESGGSLITANLANDYDRDVFAFPGNADQEQSKGCNNLIRRNRAHLITNAEDMLNVLGWELEEKPEEQSQLFIQMSEEEEKLVRIFREKGEVDIDNLSHKAQMSGGVLSMHLFNLEMKGLIKVMPGKRYSLI
ncbi:MAG: DNA-processing protein DprA [Flavobacteriales bacterium]|nr:DNA-processing protein DprA [Flavobacteriales bacterium]